MRPVVALLFLILVGCSEKKPVESPWVNICADITWLDSIQGSISQSGWQGEIYLSHYKGERVFEVNACVSCADYISTVYDCEGKIVCEFGGIAGVNTCPDYDFGAPDRLLYWKN